MVIAVPARDQDLGELHRALASHEVGRSSPGLDSRAYCFRECYCCGWAPQDSAPYVCCEVSPLSMDRNISSEFVREGR